MISIAISTPVPNSKLICVPKARMLRLREGNNGLKVIQQVERGRDDTPALSTPKSHNLSKAAQSRVAGGAICPQSDFVQSWLGARPLGLLKCSESCWGKWSFELA